MSAWAELWNEPVSFDETWLLRVAPGTGDATLVENCARQTGRLRVVADLPLTVAQSAGENFLAGLAECGLQAHIVSAVIETPRGEAGIVALDLRDEWTSLLLPCTTLDEAELGDAAAAVQLALQRGGSRAWPGQLARRAPRPGSTDGGALADIAAQPLDPAAIFPSR